MSALKEAINIMTRKGWALYHLPYYNLASTEELARLVRRGPELSSLTRYELYLILPLMEDPRDPRLVLGAMDEAWRTGRLPVYVRVREVTMDTGKRKPVPLWIMPIDCLGIGDGDEVVLVADPNAVVQYLARLGTWEHPLNILEADVHVEGFSLTHYCQVSDLRNFIAATGRPLFPGAKTLEEWERVVVKKSFGSVAH